MEVPKLYQFTLLIVIVGMLLGVGILALDKFGTAAKDSTAVTYETVAVASGSGSTANDDVTAVSFFGNMSVNSTDNVINIGNGVADVRVNWTTAGLLDVHSANFSDGNYNVSYTYLADTNAFTATSNTVTELSTIASTWLGLIITIAVLAIIITLVVRSFAFKGR